jgi:hypothetical protein
MPVDHQLAERFVKENWPILAAAAWRFHLRHGLGALIVEWGMVERWCRDSSRLFTTRYATATDDDGFNAVIANYDPKKAVVVAFSDGPVGDVTAEIVSGTTLTAIKRGAGLAAMTISAEPSPPAAHRARGH